jgi:hypothetical protein
MVPCRDAADPPRFGGRRYETPKRTTISEEDHEDDRHEEPVAKKIARVPSKAKQPKPEGRMSALDAAAKVLADTGQPMNTKVMIEAIAAKNLWTSRGGATPRWYDLVRDFRPSLQSPELLKCATTPLWDIALN